MLTKAVRIYGKDDLRLEEFELPQMKDNEILALVYSDSLCMSSYKATKQGANHKRIPDDIHINPTMIGHEFSGEIVEIGTKWKDQFNAGDKFSIQPALNYKGSLDAPGYSYHNIGGDATYVIIPNEVMEMNCLLSYKGEGYFPASLSEPMSCIIGAYHASYHTKPGSYIHEMGIVEGGSLAILAGVGPMGLGAIDYAIHCNRKPSLLVVTDIDDARLERAELLYTKEEAKKNGIQLEYVNTAKNENAEEYMLSLTNNKGFDDVMVYAPVRPVIEQADRLLGRDGCLNFFAGPTNPDFKAELNFYNVHYAFTHIVGTSGGNTDDMIESLDMMARGLINPATMVTHIGGMNAVIETTKNLPNISGGKKLIYTQLDIELTAIDYFAEKGKTDSLFKKLADISEKYNGLWSVEAENYLLKNAKKI